MSIPKSALILLLGFILCVVTNAVLPDVESLFQEYHHDNGKIEWVDDEDAFCEFVRPRGFTFLKSDLDDETVDLVRYINLQNAVEILTCFYGVSENDEDPTEVRYSYGPNKKYYLMHPSQSSNRLGMYVIRSEVEEPPEEEEILFYDHYNAYGEIKWTSDRTTSFCEEEMPSNANEVISADLDTKSVVIVSKKDEEITVECLVCEYQLENSSRSETIVYSKGPDNVFYEMRPYYFKSAHYESKPYALYRPA